MVEEKEESSCCCYLIKIVRRFGPIHFIMSYLIFVLFVLPMATSTNFMFRLREHPHGFVLGQLCVVANPESIDEIDDPMCNHVVGWAATTELAMVRALLEGREFSEVDAYLCITTSYELGTRTHALWNSYDLPYCMLSSFWTDRGMHRVLQLCNLALHPWRAECLHRCQQLGWTAWPLCDG